MNELRNFSPHLHRRILLAFGLLITLMFAGCSGGSLPWHLKPDSQMSVKELLPPKDNVKITDEYVRKGVEYLLESDYKKASEQFNTALRFDTQNSYLQFLNGLTYHLMAESGNSTQYEYATIGYELALKFDGNNWLAAQQLGRLFLKTKKYQMAQEYFARALLYQPDNVEMLYGLAQASYYAHDLETALGTINRAFKLKPDSPEINNAYSIISAASGQFEKAKAQLAVYSEIEPNKTRVTKLKERISDWEKFHKNKVILVASKDSDDSKTSKEDQSTPDTSDAKEKAVQTANESVGEKIPRMVVVDVILIRTEELETTNKGVNLLDGLFLQFEDVKYALTRTYAKDLVTDTVTTNTNQRVITTSLTIPKVKYNLNIFNIAKDHSEILARPTLVALDGQKSTFFSGSQLNVAVAGVETGNVEKIDVGVRLEVTPKFISDDTVLLNVTAARNFVESGLVGSFTQSVKTSKNEVTANAVLKFGQTLIVGGLREKQTSEVKTGVPLLRDIPIVQYLFSNETTSDFHKSILTILTPRKVTPGVYISPTNADTEEALSDEQKNQPDLKELKEAYKDIFAVDDNMHHIIRHLKKHAVFREFRDADLYDKPWYGHADSLKNIIARTLSFLYY